MAAVATYDRRTTNQRNMPLNPPGYAQGDIGQILENGVLHAAAQWQGESQYVANILEQPSPSGSSSHAMPVAAGFLAAGSVGFVVTGWAVGFGAVMFPLAGIAGLAAYALAARWLAGRFHGSRILWFVERIRRALAYEGDPGPRAN